MAITKRALLHQFLAFLPIATLSIVVGSCSGFLPSVLHQLRSGKADLQLTDEQAAFVSSFLQGGRFIVALPAGLLAERFGRKPVSLAAGTLYSLTWLGLYTTSSKEYLFIFSFFLGIGTGTVNAVHQMYSAELVSASIRGSFSSFISFNSNFGSLVESVLGVYLTYKQIVLSSFLISLVYFASIFWLTESPYYLLAANYDERAKATLTWLRSGLPDQVVANEFANMKTAVENGNKMKNSKSLFTLLTSKDNFRCVTVLIAINFSVMFTGMIVVKLYSTYLFPDDVSLIANPTSYPFFISCIEICCSLTPPLYLDRFSRRSLLYISSSTVGVVHIITAVLFYLHQYPIIDVRYIRFPLLISILMNTIVFNASLNPLVNVLRGELLPQSVRGAGAGIAVVAQSISLAFSILLFDCVQRWIGMYVNFIIFSLASLIIPVIVYSSLPETKGKTLAEIQQSLNSGNNKKNHSSKIPIA